MCRKISRSHCAASGYFASGLDKRQYSIYTEKEQRATDQPLSPQSHFSAVDCFYRDFFAEPAYLGSIDCLRCFFGDQRCYVCDALSE